MDLICALLLFLFPLQQSNQKPETVALVFGPEPERIEIVKTSKAEAQYNKLKVKSESLTAEEAKLLAALTNALGIIPTTQGSAPLLNTRERLNWEIRRGVRPPLQKPDPGR